jgi:hypothetical protein
MLIKLLTTSLYAIGVILTGALCFIGVDSFNILWSDKFLVNLRVKVGSYYLDIQATIDESLLSACEGFLLRLNEDHKWYRSSHEMLFLTCHSFEDFFLDNNAPWDTSEVLHFVKMPTVLSHNFWMSLAIH